MRYLHAEGVVKRDNNKLITIFVAISFALMATLSMMMPVQAGHNGAVVSVDENVCEATTISASIADEDGTHKVGNMRLVVDTTDGDAQSVVIPTNGDSVSLSVGPFFTSDVTTVSWNVFGGGERSYDQPLWNGFGTPTFSSDISAYAAEVGTFNWVVAGTDDPNPFVNWNEVEVQGCVPELLHSINGGGNILDETGDKKKDWDKISFGLGVENYNVGAEGEVTVRFHNVSGDDLDKTTFHSDEITEFNFFPSDSPTCDAAVNFTAVGSWDGNENYKLIFRAGDNDDTVRVTLHNDSGVIVYDSLTDFPADSDCVGTARTPHDNGNITITEY